MLKNKEYGCRRAAEAANDASAAVKAGAAALVTKNDVHRYSEKFLGMVEGDADLDALRKRVERAKTGSADNVGDIVELKTAEGLFEARARWVTEAVKRAISELELAQRGNPDFVLGRAFTDAEERTLATYFEYISLAGFPYSLAHARATLASVAVELGVDETFVAGQSFLTGLQKRSGGRLAGRKASAISKSRADAADPAVADAQFARAEEFYQQLHRDDPVRWPWKTLKEVPPNRIYNFDEEGEDPEKRRGKVVYTQFPSRLFASQL